MSAIVRGFQDLRSGAKLLASEKVPKALKYLKNNPVSSKLRGLVSKATGAVNKAANTTVGKYALRGAAKVAAATVGYKFISRVSGKANGAIGSVSRATSAINLGVQIIEELDPAKLKRPHKEGPSISRSAYLKNLAQTTASGLLGSLIAGVPLASGLPVKITAFKSLAKLKSSLRLFDPRKTTTVSTAHTVAPVGLIQQRGLLEDEIMYRLVLLAENVYEPIAKYAVSQGYGRPVIIEGFRSENTGTSQHERGEAIDIVIPGATDATLHTLATWVRDNVAFDQLILCFSAVAGGQSWIHISYTPESRRREVLTKAFNDTFESGLRVYSAYTDASILAADRATSADQTKVAEDMMQRLAARDSKLNPVGVNTAEQTIDIPSATGTTKTPGGPVASKDPYIGHPGGTCALESMPEHDDGGFEETPSFQEQVEEAQAEVFATYGSDLSRFNADGSVVDEVAYCESVATVLQSYGFCAVAGGPPDEVGVKINNQFNDQYDLVNGSTMQPHCLYTVTCRPSRF